MLARLYGAITDLRNRLYEKGIYKSFSLGAKTVSIGNITVGGTGKTPLVARVAEILAANGEKVCVLTRGYKRENPQKGIIVSDGETILADAKQTGDEPLELARRLRGKAFVIADADRVRAAECAREKFGATAFVLDDAFQHRRVKRDLDIVVIDATNPFGNYKTLPTGVLRESLHNLKRADLIVVSRANLVENKNELIGKIREYNAGCPIFTAENKISGLIELKNYNARKPRDNDIKKELKNKKALAFCALGNPNNFYEQLRRENFNLISIENFPDHHFYTQKDIERLNKAVVSSESEILLTTAKDAVKLKELRFDAPCYVVEIEVFFEDTKGFLKILQSI